MNNRKRYLGVDIEKYHQGRLSAQEMHALEKAALDDPFLADAVDGYQYTTSANEDLNILRTELQKKTTRSKIIAIHQSKHSHWLRIAALLLILAGTGWFTYKVTDLSNQPEIAAETKTKKQEQVIKDTSVPNDEVTKKESTTEINPNNKIDKNIASKKLKKTNLNTEAVIAATGARKHKTSGKKNQNPTETHAVLHSIATFKGKVLDDEGNPIQHASVIINEDKRVTTDSKGNFTIKSKDSITNATIASIGYSKSRVRLTNNDENTVVLMESNESMSEAVVTRGLSKKTEGNVAANETEFEPEPIDGWFKFLNYISKNIKRDSTITGEVHLSFDINEDGYLKNIKVEKSLCSLCDNEAIRLLKEGPKWNRVEGKKGKVVVKF